MLSDSITSLVWWCRALGVKVSFFDILDRWRLSFPPHLCCINFYLTIIPEKSIVLLFFLLFGIILNGWFFLSYLPLSLTIWKTHVVILQPTDWLNRERVRSSFSWEALRLFLVRVLTQGVALLPHAVIVGNTEFVFRDTSQNAQSNPPEPSQIVQSNSAPRYLLTSSVEKLSLVRAIDRWWSPLS